MDMYCSALKVSEPANECFSLRLSALFQVLNHHTSRKNLWSFKTPSNKQTKNKYLRSKKRLQRDTCVARDANLFLFNYSSCCSSSSSRDFVLCVRRQIRRITRAFLKALAMGREGLQSEKLFEHLLSENIHSEKGQNEREVH